MTPTLPKRTLFALLLLLARVSPAEAPGPAPDYSNAFDNLISLGLPSVKNATYAKLTQPVAPIAVKTV